MSKKRYIVELTEEERAILTALLNSEKRVAVRKRRRAQILLKIDQGEHGPAWTDERAADAFDVHVNTVRSIRRDLVERGFDNATDRKKQAKPSRKPKLDAAGEAELLAIAQGAPPKGRTRWTLHLLADQLVVRNIVEDSISHETVRTALKKTTSSLTAKSCG